MIGMNLIDKENGSDGRRKREVRREGENQKIGREKERGIFCV